LRFILNLNIALPTRQKGVNPQHTPTRRSGPTEQMQFRRAQVLHP